MEATRLFTRCLSASRVIRLISAAWVLMLAGLLAGCDTMSPQEGDVALGGEEVTKLISGNHFRGPFEGQMLTMVYFENGVVRGRWGLSGSDSGTWTIDGDTYCHRWVRYFDATRRCYKWWRRPSDYLLENVDAFSRRSITGQVREGKPSGF